MSGRLPNYRIGGRNLLGYRRAFSTCRCQWCGKIFADLTYDRDGLQDRDIVARCAEDFEDDTRYAGGDFESRFVGFDIANGSFGGNGVAFFHAPRTDDAGFDRITLSWHDEYMCHYIYSLSISVIRALKPVRSPVLH
jgi:hypothetical protein